ncbi:transcriptional regulator family: C2H2 zinc finger [Aspergillus niger]|nr:transcriptional regulator family: C2H2 zinc finger [Aspergillus niger]
MAADPAKPPEENLIPDSSRPYPCDECTKTFTRNENLRRHKRARHDRASSHDFECDGCHAVFTRSDVFKRHRGRCRVEALNDHISRPETSPQESYQGTADMPPLSTATDVLTSTQAPAANVMPGDHFWEGHSSFATSLSRDNILPSPILCCSTICNDEEAQACVHWRRTTWQSGQQELRYMVSNQCGEIRKPWVMQAWILYMIYGVYAGGEASQFRTAREMLRQIVDAVREVGLSQQEIAMPESQSWLYDIGYPRGDESRTLYARWTSYIAAESTRVALYTLFFLDSHVFVPCNSRPLMSSMELGWELPFPTKLWEAKDPEIWIRRFGEYFGVSAFPFTNDLLQRPRGLAAASLTMATQQVMTEAPGTELSAALEASPFAAFCVLANLDTLVRDFTRCYYQMPPSYSDPNPFHILTQSQTKSVHMAIRNIGKIVKDAATASDSPQFFQWRTNALFIVSLQVNLCRPDQLLIGGIVDNSLIAGLAASTHLMRGNFVAVRRSAPLLAPRLGSNEGVLALLSELSAALASIFSDDSQNFSYEAPWVTVTSYGVLLCIWGALRCATTEIRDHLNTFNELPRTSEPCMLIFNALIEATLLYSPATRRDRDVRDPRLWSRDREVFSTLLEQGQLLFADLVKTFCQQRLVWSIGPSMLAVLREIPDAATCDSDYQRPPAGAHLRRPHELGACTVQYTQTFFGKNIRYSQTRMSPSISQVGWYGLGSMGLGMSLNLQRYLQAKNLPPLRYSNRTISKGDILRDAGAVPEEFDALVQKSNVIFTMISTDDVLIDLLEKASTMGNSLKGKIFVDTSTIHPDTSEWAAKRLKEHGATFIAAPVFGASPVAAAGKLMFAVAGPVTVVETIRPLIMNVMGRSIIEMGEDVRKSSLLNISGNILVISFMEVIAEAQVFAEVAGIGTQQMEDFIGNMFGSVLQSYSKRITSGAYAPPLDTAPGFAAALACKDMKHALSIADSHNVRLHTLETASKRLNTAREYAGENLDSSAIYGIARQEAGLSFWSANSRQQSESS